VARGAGFKPSPFGERGSLRLRQGFPYGTLRVALTQPPLRKFYNLKMKKPAGQKPHLPSVRLYVAFATSDYLISKND